MTKYLRVLIPAVLAFHISFSQEDSLHLYRGWKAQNQASLFIADVNLRMRVSHDVLNSGKGLGMEAGFNPGYLFNRHLLLGIFGGFGMRDVFYHTKFSSSYLNDFNRSFNPAGLQGNDSLVANTFASLINKGGFHDREIYYGIIFRLPYKWAPVVKLYTGKLYRIYKTTDHLPIGPEGDDDNVYFNINQTIQWGAEIFLFRGYTKIHDYGKLPFAKKKPLLFCNSILPISFYIEHISEAGEYVYDQGNLSVNLAPKRILSQSFIQKYTSNYYFGFRLLYGTF